MRILIIQQKMVGDVLTSSILFKALRKKYPEATLHYLIQPHTRAVVENNPIIDKIITYPPALNSNPWAFLKFCRRLKKENYSVIIDVYSKISTGILSLLTGAKIRLGYRKFYTSYCYSGTFRYKSSPESNAGLAIENRMLLLNGLAEDFPIQEKPKIYLDEAEKKRARNKLKHQNINFHNPLLMCGILGSSKLKSYPADFMVNLLDKLVEQVPSVQILFNYLPHQENEAASIYRRCNSNTRQRIFFSIYEHSLKGFILNCANCDLYFGNEGGAANIMKALDKPTFSIHSTQVKKIIWAIYEDGRQHKAVHREDYPASNNVAKDNTSLKPEYFSEELIHFIKNHQHGGKRHQK